METFSLIPEYVYEETPVWATVQTPFESGAVQRRALWPRPKRTFRLVWQSMVRAEKEYINSFFRYQVGPAGSFSWVPPDPIASPDFPGSPGTTAGGALGNRDYYYQITWTTAAGETLVSTERAFALTNGQLFTLALPAFPSNVTSAKIYVSATTNTETLQATVTTSGSTWTEPSTGLVAGAARPSANTATETLTVYMELDAMPWQKLTAGVYATEMTFVEIL